MGYKGYTQQKTYITAEEVADMLGLRPSTVYNRKAGTTGLKRVKVGRAVRWIKEEVEALKEKLEKR
jgi:excisionase family DNA binding protein